MATHSHNRLFSAEIQQMKLRGQAIGNGAAPENDLQRDILDAINGLREDISNAGEGSHAEALKQEIIEAAALKSELKGLSDAILETKKEIAGMRRPDAEVDHLATMTNQLDAVVKDTELATETILESAEFVDEMIDALRVQASGEDEHENLDKVSEHVTRIFEACNFQDITGQRITKVVNTLKYIEERVDKMMDILGGEDSFEGIQPPDEGPVDPDKALLSGPQLDEENQSSQDDIDALFD